MTSVGLQPLFRSPESSHSDDGSPDRVTASGPPRLLFLPGAGGRTSLWRPVAQGLSHPGPRELIAWPGFGGVEPDLTITGLEDLVQRVLGRVTEPVVLFAQSMGGVIALRAALAAQEQIRALVLSVTSGGIDVTALGAVDWRPQFERENPGLPRWFLDARDDLTEQLHRVQIPTLLLWGDADPISPVCVGQRLAALLPNAKLLIVPGGTHDLVFERASDILPHIECFLNNALTEKAV